MGYCIDVEVNECVISASKVQDAWQVLAALAMKLKYDEYGPISTLDEVLYRFCYVAELDKTGDCSILYFDGEKSADEEEMWKALAPFLDQDCNPYVSFEGEDGTLWRYEFPDGKLKELHGEVNWS